jgi:hypothetical protein
MISRRYSHSLGILLIVVAILVGMRLALPFMVKDYLNDKLAVMGDYRGHIGDVDIALWRGAYVLHGMDVVKVDDKVPVPFFAVDTIDISVSWRALFRGSVVAEVDFINPELHFVDGDDGKTQAGAGTDWRAALQQLVPIEIDRLDIHNGELHFHNFGSEPPVHLVLTELSGSFANITNADRSEDPVPARFSLDGLILEDAQVALAGHLDPLGDFRNFDINMKITDFDLPRINDLTEAYGSFDIKSGTGNFVMELEAIDGELSGYAKPLLDNVVILDFEKDLEKGILNVAWQGLVGGLARIFRNHPKDRIASQIEIRGSLGDQNISGWQAFVSVLRNAFVDAYEAQFGRE